MHNNFYFLRQLTARLNQLLQGTVISECFSQNKDELLIRFETHGEPFFIKASLSSGMSHLSFLDVFNRAKKNSIDLFQEIIGRRVIHLRQFENERSFAIIMDSGFWLLFEMYGNRSNIILLEEELIISAFRSNIPVGEKIIPDTLDRKIDWSLNAFIQDERSPEKIYFTLGKIVWSYLDTKKFTSLDRKSQWELILATVGKLEQPVYYLSHIKGVPHLTLLQFDDSKEIDDDPVKASNTFFQVFSQQTGLVQEKGKLLSILNTRLKGCENYYEKNFRKLSEIETDHAYRTWGDLIMAHLHEIRPGHENVVFPDFYDQNRMVEIKLKKDLSPQANAAVFYRKAKNQHLEIERIQQALERKEKEITQLKNQIAELEQITDLRTLRKTFSFPESETKNKNAPSIPYHEFFYEGYRILVGRNAQMNDELTLRFSYKEDLWLHAKDVSGSHVIIKHQSGKTFPKNVIERAAQLAAYNSKRKTDSFCPVIVTPKKFVRKRKGDPPGAMVVDREQVIMVEPRLENDR